MYRNCRIKSTIASLVAATMLFTGNISAVCAADLAEEPVIETSDVEVLAEETVDSGESVVEGDGEQAQEKYNIEINRVSLFMLTRICWKVET